MESLNKTKQNKTKPNQTRGKETLALYLAIRTNKKTDTTELERVREQNIHTHTQRS